MDGPQEGKLYALTGGPNTPALSNGNTWAESEVQTCVVCGEILTDAEIGALDTDIDFVPHKDHLVRRERDHSYHTTCRLRGDGACYIGEGRAKADHPFERCADGMTDPVRRAAIYTTCGMRDLCHYRNAVGRLCMGTPSEHPEEEK